MAQAQAQQAHGSGQPPWNYNATSQMTPGQLQTVQQVGQTSIVQGHSSPLIHQQASQLQQINRTPGLTGAVPRPPSVQRSHPTGPLGGPGPGPSLPNQLSPNMNPQFPFPMNSVSGSVSSPLTGPIGLQPSRSGTTQLPVPLEKSRFDNAYKSFCSSKGVKHDPRMMNYEGRDIDLYMLHSCVMQEGGIGKVSSFLITPNYLHMKKKQYHRLLRKIFGASLEGGWVLSTFLPAKQSQQGRGLL